MNEANQSLERQHAEKLPLYERYAASLEQLLSKKLTENNVKHHLIESRAKDTKSFLKKVSNPVKDYRKPFEDITDLVGLRVITFYEDDIDEVEKQLVGLFKQVQPKEVKKPADESTFGYRSVHFIVQIEPGTEIPDELTSLTGLKFEIQVRTVLQHAWAAISHKLEYKRDSDVPENLKRKLFRLAALFEIADDEFESLRALSQQEDVNIGKKLEQEETDIPIDLASLKQHLNLLSGSAFLQDARNAGFAVDRPNTVARDDNETFSKLIQICKLAGLTTIRQLDETLESASVFAHEFFRELIRRNKERGSSSWSASVAFICQLLILREKSSQLSEDHLIALDWDRGMAEQVLSVAKKFARD
ncbi:hypothetical protein KVG96_18475 [Pseudomonas sp. COR58]|uniref:RelA/SpoT domain-containing protein n=1 Tax=Pseudomonas ekonensis TaxID=2842353 RepID=A0ABS6PHL2_9PSED|nr:hypothetical protein [Pseudomonas ekonensis]MBV4459945.1 hypothetical protein [Pseudomonas ekonensis]